MKKSTEAKPKWKRSKDDWSLQHSLFVGNYELLVWRDKKKKTFSGGIFSHHTDQGRKALAKGPLPIGAKTLTEAKQTLVSLCFRIIIDELTEELKILAVDDDRFAAIDDLLKRK